MREDKAIGMVFGTTVIEAHLSQQNPYDIVTNRCGTFDFRFQKVCWGFTFNPLFSFVSVVYSIESQRTAHDQEKLKISEIKKLSPHREAIRCLVNVAGQSKSLTHFLRLSMYKSHETLPNVTYLAMAENVVRQVAEIIAQSRTQFYFSSATISSNFPFRFAV